MPNPTGYNGHDQGAVPPDDELREELLQYARERLPLERRIKRLQNKFGYYIRVTKLKELNKKFNVPSSRKPPPLPLATAIICEKMADDVARRNGPNEVAKAIAAEGEYVIPRDMVRAVMMDNDPLGFELRYHANKTRISRGVLQSKGLHHEYCADGHEKLSSMALKMGPVGMGIYAFREKLSGCPMRMVVLPNARLSAAVAHVYVDMVSKNGFIPHQITTDHGSETGHMYAIHCALRKIFAPELDETEWPPFVAIKSTHNISIENLWSRWLKWAGTSCRETISLGQTNGLFNPLDELDVNLFQWLWSQIVQKRLNDFMQYWTCHRVRKQKKKAMPSAAPPMDIYEDPNSYNYEDLKIPVDINVVEALRAQIPMSHEEAFQFVSDKFKAAVEEAYTEIGSPDLKLQNGWTIYAQLQEKLRRMYDDSV